MWRSNLKLGLIKIQMELQAHLIYHKLFSIKLRTEIFLLVIFRWLPKVRKDTFLNPNVLVEYGYALRHLGWERVISVFNSA